MREHEAHNNKTFVILEKRGKTEDSELELEFRRVCDSSNYEKVQMPFQPKFVDKKSNCAGLQFADLIARPVGMVLST